jgi:hypothetical protein
VKDGVPGDVSTFFFSPFPEIDSRHNNLFRNKTLEINMRALRTACCVEDLRNLARSRIPKPFFDYVDAGSWSESTYRANEVDFAALTLRQKVLVDIEKRSVRSAMLGHSVTMPLALAPCGFGGMMWQDGEIAAAQVVVLQK